MFTECSLVMFVMQAIVFSPWFKEATRWLIAPALSVLAAASAGVLSPILTYWISAKAGSAQGWELGKQTAAASLGVTLGSAAGGLLFNAAALPGASFVLAAGLAVLGILLSLGLPHLLVLPNSSSPPVSMTIAFGPDLCMYAGEQTQVHSQRTLGKRRRRSSASHRPSAGPRQAKRVCSTSQEKRMDMMQMMQPMPPK